MVSQSDKVPKDAPTMRWHKRAGGWLVNIAVLVAVGWGFHLWQTRDMLAQTEQVEPFKTVLLTGEVGLVAPDKTRKTVLYFFAPWCGVCRASIGNVARLDPTETQVIVIALDYDSREDVQQFIDDVGIDLPVHLGTPALRDFFRIKAYPSYYVLDPEFRVLGRSVGYSSALGLSVRT